MNIKTFWKSRMNKLSKVAKFQITALLCSALFFLLLILGHNFYSVRDRTKRANLTMALQPKINEILSKTSLDGNLNMQVAYHINLQRPYVIVYLGSIQGGFGKSIFDMFDGHQVTGVMPNGDNNHNASDYKTLVLMKELELNRAAYQTRIENSSSDIGPPKYCYQYRYYLWAFDTDTEKLGACTILEDDPLLPEFHSWSKCRSIGYNDLYSWADSVIAGD